MIHNYTRFVASSIAVLGLAFGGCSNANSSENQTSSAEKITQLAAPANTGDNQWDVVADTSYIRFSAEQEGVAFSGEFKEFSSTIDFDPVSPETGSVEITIPLSSVDAGSKDRNSTLPGKVWFSTKSFPTAVFTSDNITREGEDYLAKGTLTLKGAAVPVALSFTLKIDGNQAVMIGKSDIDRTDWGVGAAPWDTDEWVSKSVTLDVKVTANRVL